VNEWLATGRAAPTWGDEKLRQVKILARSMHSKRIQAVMIDFGYAGHM
jgi:hypothetical protein